MSMTRELKQVSDNKFLLLVNDKENKYKTEKEYSREELRDIYDNLKVQKDQLSMTIRDNNKKLKQNEVKLSKEEEKILALLEKATKRIEYDKVKAQNDQQVKDRETLEKQMKEIYVKLPEVHRKK